MARLGIDDQFWLEIVSVVAKLGDQDKAIGNAIRWFRFAQEKHKHGRLVTEAEFKVNGFDEALIPIFATRVDGGLKCIGAEKHFGWLQQKIDAGRAGGKASAKRPRDSKGRLTKTQAHPSEHIQANPSGHQPSPSPSPSPSCTNSRSFEELATSSPMAVYIEAYQEKYGRRPEVGKREGKILKTFAENHPDRWPDLIRGYLKMPDSWAVARSHPVEPLTTKANEIGRFLATGKVVTKKVIEDAEKIIDKAQGTDKRRRRPIAEVEAEYKQQLQLAAGGEHGNNDNA